MQHLILCDSAVRSLESSPLFSSVLPEAIEGRTLQIQHPPDVNTWDLLVIKPMWLHADTKLLAFVPNRAEKL